MARRCCGGGGVNRAHCVDKIVIAQLEGRRVGLSGGRPSYPGDEALELEPRWRRRGSLFIGGDQYGLLAIAVGKGSLRVSLSPRKMPQRQRKVRSRACGDASVISSGSCGLGMYRRECARAQESGGGRGAKEGRKRATKRTKWVNRP